MPSHSHSFTPSGTVSSSFTGSSVTTGGMSANSTGQFGGTDGGMSTNKNNFTKGCAYSEYKRNFDGNGTYPQMYKVTIDVSHTHSVTAKGTVSSSFSGIAGTTNTSGSGTSFSILPPYVVKYCFERTA